MPVKYVCGASSIMEAARDIAGQPGREEAFYVLDVDEVVRRIRLWRQLLPRVELFYGIFNPAPLASAMISSERYERLPYGLCNAPATFQRAVNRVIQGLDNTYAYLDDIIVATNTWSEHLLQLQRLFAKLLTAGLTINLDITKPFILHVDASGTGIGGVLMQQRGEDVLPVSYYSYKLKTHQKNYSTIEKELLSIVLNLQHFESYLQGARSTTIYSHHNPLRFLQQAQFNNQWLLRWALYLQNFSLEIFYIKGSDNIIADALSRVYEVETAPPTTLPPEDVTSPVTTGFGGEL